MSQEDGYTEEEDRRRGCHFFFASSIIKHDRLHEYLTLSLNRDWINYQRNDVIQTLRTAVYVLSKIFTDTLIEWMNTLHRHSYGEDANAKMYFVRRVTGVTSAKIRRLGGSYSWTPLGVLLMEYFFFKLIISGFRAKLEEMVTCLLSIKDWFYSNYLNYHEFNYIYWFTNFNLQL